MCTYNYNMFCNYQCFFVKKIFAGTNTREISEMTLFFSHLHLNFKHFTTLFFICRYAILARSVTKRALIVIIIMHHYILKEPLQQQSSLAIFPFLTLRIQHCGFVMGSPSSCNRQLHNLQHELILSQLSIDDYSM